MYVHDLYTCVQKVMAKKFQQQWKESDSGEKSLKELTANLQKEVAEKDDRLLSLETELIAKHKMLQEKVQLKIKHFRYY